MSGTSQQPDRRRPAADWSALDLLPDAAVVVAADGRVSFANRAAARLVDAAPDRLTGMPAGDALPLRDEAWSDWWTTAKPLEGDAALLPRIPERDLHLVTSLGTARPVALTAQRVRDEHGRLAFLMVSLRRADRRQRLDEARSDLVSTVSHELRSPLTSVKGFTKTLLAKWERFTDDQKRQMLATVNEDADRVTRLLGELLDVSRIDAGRLQLRRQMIDVPALARQVVERLRLDPGGDRIAEPADIELPRVYADPDKVAQVLTNLVENALKYGEGTVEIGATAAQEEVSCVVSDEGGSIDPAHLRHIFTKFFRRAGEHHSGTGLGLYISKGIIEAHGGHIWAESAPGHGSRFVFTLPRGGLELAGIPTAPPEAGAGWGGNKARE